MQLYMGKFLAWSGTNPRLSKKGVNTTRDFMFCEYLQPSPITHDFHTMT